MYIFYYFIYIYIYFMLLSIENEKLIRKFPKSRIHSGYLVKLYGLYLLGI